MQRMIEELKIYEIEISGYAVCPHQPTTGCGCRKPAAGLIYAAAALFELTLAQCALVGDSRTDVEAASLAGCRGILVRRDDSDSFRSAFEEAFAFVNPEIAA